MQSSIDIVINNSGHPVAHVPCADAWSLVEFLSNQRVHVSYTFEESHMAACFEHMDAPAVRDLLDTWARTEGRLYSDSRAVLNPV